MKVGDVCQRCERIVELLNIMVLALNCHVPIGELRPWRRLTIKSFKIEKI